MGGVGPVRDPLPTAPSAHCGITITLCPSPTTCTGSRYSIHEFELSGYYLFAQTLLSPPTKHSAMASTDYSDFPFPQLQPAFVCNVRSIPPPPGAVEL